MLVTQASFGKSQAQNLKHQEKVGIATNYKFIFKYVPYSFTNWISQLQRGLFFLIRKITKVGDVKSLCNLYGFWYEQSFSSIWLAIGMVQYCEIMFE